MEAKEPMSNEVTLHKARFTDPTYLLHDRQSREILSTARGRVFVHGQETSDVERIGAAFVEWAKVWAQEHGDVK